MRTLYVLATWGPCRSPMTTCCVSAPRPTPSSAPPPWAILHAAARGGRSGAAAAGVFSNCDATSLRVAMPASMFTPYERIAFVTPIVDGCPFTGEANPTEVLLNGHLYRALAAHELGHTLSLGHASRWTCNPRCSIDDYGNPFSAMGSGDGDFNAWEKTALSGSAESSVRGGTRRTSSVPSRADALAAGIGRQDGGERVLVRVARAGDALVHRRLVQPAGVAVVAGPAPGGSSRSIRAITCSCPTPAAWCFAYAPGESFVRRIFRVTVQRHALQSARASGSSGSTVSRLALGSARGRRGAASGCLGTPRASEGAASTATRGLSTAVRCEGSAPTFRSPPGRQPSGSHEAPIEWVSTRPTGREPRTTGGCSGPHPLATSSLRERRVSAR